MRTTLHCISLEKYITCSSMMWSRFDVAIKLKSPAMDVDGGPATSTPLLEDWCPCTIFSSNPSGGTHVPFPPQKNWTKAKAKAQICAQTHLWLETFTQFTQSLIDHFTFHCNMGVKDSYWTENFKVTDLCFIISLHNITLFLFVNCTIWYLW